MMLGRTWSTGDSHRYGFQGQEVNKDIAGEGNAIEFKYRSYDPRIGKMNSIDPLSRKYPYLSPYSFSGNRVIDMVELEGLEPTDPPYKWTITESTEYPHGTMMRANGFYVFHDYDKHGDSRYQWHDESSNTWKKFEPASPDCTSCGIHTIMDEGWEATKKYGGPTLQIIGGIIAVAAAIPSGGTSLGVYGSIVTGLGVTSGVYSAVDGMATLTLLAADNEALVDDIPSGFLNATVGLSITYFEGDTEIDKYVAATLSIVEGAVLISTPNQSDLQLLDKATTVVMTSVTVSSTISSDEED